MSERQSDGPLTVEEAEAVAPVDKLSESSFHPLKKSDLIC
jgi:hypothetical protein